jgi:predicted metal-dependent enzyme (double-stranded beta helix superfamily)
VWARHAAVGLTGGNRNDITQMIPLLDAIRGGAAGTGAHAAGHASCMAIGSFSIIALVWRPGQVTGIHDHLTWCVFGVIEGVEHEELFDADLNLIGSSDNHIGDVSGFAPPGDIHRVHNTASTTAISIHVYGTDVTRIGSSVRRYYD